MWCRGEQYLREGESEREGSYHNLNSKLESHRSNEIGEHAML